MNLEPNKKQWREVYRLARQPDRYLADPMILKFPVRWLLEAIRCLETRNK